MNSKASNLQDKLLTLRVLRGKCTGVISSIERSESGSKRGILSEYIAIDFDLIRDSLSSLYPSCEVFLPPSIPVEKYNDEMRCHISVNEIDMYFRQIINIIDCAISDLSIPGAPTDPS